MYAVHLADAANVGFTLCGRLQRAGRVECLPPGDLLSAYERPCLACARRALIAYEAKKS